jgi:heavy metal sensor kinase
VKLSVRARLTAWYLALLTATSIALGSFLILELRSALIQEIDGETIRASGSILESIAEEADESAAHRAANLAEAIEEYEKVARAVLPHNQATAGQILTADGRPLTGYGAGGADAPWVTAEVRARALAGPAFTVTAPLGPDAQRYRVRVTAFREGDQQRLLVFAISLQRVEDDVSKLLVLFLSAAPPVLLGTTAAAYWLADRALRPVGQMTADAADIRADRLHERVVVPRSDDELKRLALTLNAMLDRVEEGVNQQRRLIADASHELRTPLAVMRTEIDVSLRVDDLPDAARDVLSSALEEINRMSRTVSNLLTLAALDEGKLELLTAWMDLRTCIDEAVDTLRPLAMDKKIRFEVAGEPLEVQADAPRIRLAFANLLDNAIRYSPIGGVVHISIWRRAGEVGVTVADEGPGIPPEHQEHLFDRFYRVDRVRHRSDGGSGLGLAICREIALAHGGATSVDSKPGSGSAFSLTLPAWRARPQNERAAVAGLS